jgi:hypothetical protein
MLKSRLQKLDGLTHAELKENITKDKYRKLIKGAYERPEKYISNKNKTIKIDGKSRKINHCYRVLLKDEQLSFISFF